MALCPVNPPDELRPVLSSLFFLSFIPRQAGWFTPMGDTLIYLKTGVTVFLKAPSSDLKKQAS
jgi:hypothetical protein